MRKRLLTQLAYPTQEHLHTKMFRSAPHPASQADSISDRLLGIAPNLAKVVDLVSGMYESKREVDTSLVRILQLWCDHRDSDPAVRQSFTDAVRYLEFLLSLREKVTERDEGPVAAYRVTLPIDFGDGVLHPSGDIVRLSLAKASQHSHALIAVEDAEPTSERKLA